MRTCPKCGSELDDFDEECLACSTTGVVLRFGNERGLTGPDYAIVELRNGMVIEVSDEGLNVYESLPHFQSGELAKQGLVFESP